MLFTAMPSTCKPSTCNCWRLQLDRGLPDYVVPADAFDAGRRHAWAPGNRFRMYFGGKKAGPTKRSGEHNLEMQNYGKCYSSAA